MKVIVYDNQIEKAIRDLKRKLSKEGFYSEIKERRFYDKPSVQKKKKQGCQKTPEKDEEVLTCSPKILWLCTRVDVGSSNTYFTERVHCYLPWFCHAAERVSYQLVA